MINLQIYLLDALGCKLSFTFYLYTVLVCLFFLSDCLCPIKVKTAKPIGPTFFVGPRVTPGKIYE